MSFTCFFVNLRHNRRNGTSSCLLPEPFLGIWRLSISFLLSAFVSIYPFIDLDVEGKNNTAHHCQQYADDLLEGQILSEYEVVEGGHDDKGAMNNAVGDASHTDASCYIGQDNGEGGEEPDRKRSNNFREGQI